jgi:hypothetical protein
VIGDGDDYYIDGFENAVPGKRPTKKSFKTFVDSEGYIQEIGEHEKIPEKGGLISWLNNVDVANDPEVREALGEEALYFEHEVAEGDARVLLVGTLGKNGWNVNARSQSEDGEDFRFRLPKQLTRETAIAEAEKYALMRLGPQLKTLSACAKDLLQLIVLARSWVICRVGCPINWPTNFCKLVIRVTSWRF